MMIDSHLTILTCTPDRRLTRLIDEITYIDACEGV